MAACIQDGGVTQKMTAWEFFRIKCRRYPQDGGVPTNDGITHKTVLCLQDSGVHTRWRRYQQDAYKMATVTRFCEFYPQDGGVHTRWRRYPKDDCVGVFSYKMSALPTRWRCIYKWWHYPQDGVVPTRWRCAYKMATLPTRWWLYPQDAYKVATVPCFCEFYPQDGSVHTR